MGVETPEQGTAVTEDGTSDDAELEVRELNAPGCASRTD